MNCLRHILHKSNSMYGILHFIGSSIRNRPLKAQRLINFRSLRSSTIFTNSFPSRDLFGQCYEMTNKHFIYGNYYILDNRTADQEAESRLKISSAVQCSDSAVSCLIRRTVWFLHHLFTDHDPWSSSKHEILLLLYNLIFEYLFQQRSRSQRKEFCCLGSRTGR